MSCPCTPIQDTGEELSSQWQLTALTDNNKFLLIQIYDSLSSIYEFFSQKANKALFIYEMWKSLLVLLLKNKSFQSVSVLCKKNYLNIIVKVVCEQYTVKMNYHRASSPRQGSFNCWKQSLIDFINQFDLLNNTSRVGLKENLYQFIFCSMCPLFWLSFGQKHFIHWLILFWKLREDKTFQE